MKRANTWFYLPRIFFVSQTFALNLIAFASQMRTKHHAFPIEFLPLRKTPTRLLGKLLRKVLNPDRRQ